jgi:hypothetical protein
MHEFYRRMQAVFQRAGSNRNQFCRKYGHKYQSLQAYWNTDKLPPGNVLADLADAYDVSLDMLVMGRSAPEQSEENPTLARLVGFLRQQDSESLQRIDGALQMFRYLALAGSLSSAIRGSGTGAPAGGAGGGSADLISGSIRDASERLADLSRVIEDSAMGEKEKEASRQLVRRIVLDIFQREGKEEWASLEEVP